MTMQPARECINQVRPVQFVTVGDRTDVPAPLIRVTTCGLLSIETVQEVVSTDPPQARYAPLTPEQLRGRGTAPALLLLKLLVSRPKRYALRDWLMEQYCQDRDLLADARLDNLAWLLRKLVCPPGYGELRTHLVAHVRSASDSGNGYQLAPYPLIWVDSEALTWNGEQAARMERFGDDPLPLWERAYDLAKRGIYLPDELYSDWAEIRRAEVTGMLRQSVQALARLYQERHGKAGEEEALCLLRSYWQEHPREEDVLRPLMELLGQRECYQEALEYYERLCMLLEEDNAEPDPRTRDVAEYVKTKQMQRSQRKQAASQEEQETFPAELPTAFSALEKRAMRDLIVEAVRQGISEAAKSAGSLLPVAGCLLRQEDSLIHAGSAKPTPSLLTALVFEAMMNDSRQEERQKT